MEPRAITAFHPGGRFTANDPNGGGVAPPPPRLCHHLSDTRAAPMAVSPLSPWPDRQDRPWSFWDRPRRARTFVRLPEMNSTRKVCHPERSEGSSNASPARRIKMDRQGLPIHRGGRGGCRRGRSLVGARSCRALPESLRRGRSKTAPLRLRRSTADRRSFCDESFTTFRVTNRDCSAVA